MAITIEIILDHTLVTYYLALLINPKKVKELPDEKLMVMDKKFYLKLSDVIEERDIKKLGRLKDLLRLVGK